MQGTVPAAALILLAALALPASADEQTGVASLRRPEPTGLLDRNEAAEVARAMDEAERRTGRTIHVDVVVDETGRRVSTGWTYYSPPDAAGHATETPMPVLAEDVNAPDGIVVLVDPFEGTGSFVEAPGLSDREERYLSDLMTSRFRRGSYGAGLIAAARGLEDRLAPPRTLPSVPSRHETATGSGISATSVALFAGGTVAVISLLGYFLRGERYRNPPGPEKGVRFVAARRDADAALSALAPRVMLLAEREMAVLGRMRRLERRPSAGSRSGAEGLLREAVSGGFWERFVAATALVGEDPEAALPELRRLSTEAEAALCKLDEAERALRDPWSEEGLAGEKDFTRRDENDG